MKQFLSIVRQVTCVTRSIGRSDTPSAVAATADTTLLTFAALVNYDRPGRSNVIVAAASGLSDLPTWSHNLPDN